MTGNTAWQQVEEKGVYFMNTGGDEKVIDIGSITAEKLLWAFEKDEKTGNVTIVPMNGEQIVIHGKTEAEMFCSILTQCFQ